MKLSVVISVVDDPTGRTQPDGTFYKVFKIEAFYTVTYDRVPPAMNGWTNNNSKSGIINKYTAYADSIAQLESKISTLDIEYWGFPPSDSNTDTNNIGG